MARRLVLGLVLVCVGLLLGVVSAGLYVHSQQREREALPMYERETADVEACRIAEMAIAGHRAPAISLFAGDCDLPVVTRVWTKPGFVIVTRTVKATDRDGAQRFSALLDGRRPDRWRLVDVRPTAGDIVLDLTKAP